MLDVALRQLTQLRRLAISCSAVTSVPPSITALGCLERLFFSCGAADPASLPPGPWLLSLRWLGTDWAEALVAAEDGVLGQMPRLEYLCLFGNPTAEKRADAWDALWALLASHPPLRCFGEWASGGSCITGCELGHEALN